MWHFGVLVLVISAFLQHNEAEGYLLDDNSHLVRPRPNVPLYCIVCDGERSLVDCNKRHMQLCGSHEECYMQVYRVHGVNHYYGGCGSTNNCAYVRSPNAQAPAKFRQQGVHICGECCPDTVCRMSLCQHTTQVDDCTDCDDASTLSECTTRRHCPSENCYMQVFKDTITGRNRIYAGCAITEECAAVAVQALRYNKPTAPAGQPVCGECCSSRSECNSALCAQAVAHVPSATPPSATAGGGTAFCTVCNGETSLQDCNKNQVQTCANNEECYMQVFFENGNRHYYGGCGQTNNCDHVQTPTATSPVQYIHNGRLICGECCQNPVCYLTLCRQITPVEFCAQCDDASSLSECTHFQHCPGEVCYLQVYKDTVHGRNKLFAGCSLPEECAAVHVQSLTTNTSIASPGSPVCGECCSDRSLCNSDLCAQAVSSVPSAPMTTPTTIPTTHSAPQGEICPVCNGETSLQECSKHQMQKCASDEECYMQVFTENGINHYYGGCGQTNNCAHVQSPSSVSPTMFRHPGRQICGECCQDPVCYMSLCQQISLVDFCAHCDDASSMSECTHFQQCPGEECYLQVFKDNIHGRNRIFAGCALPQACAAVRVQGLTTNTSTALSGSPACGECCSDRSVCNSGLCVQAAAVESGYSCGCEPLRQDVECKKYGIASVPSTPPTTPTTTTTSVTSPQVCTVCKGETSLQDCNKHQTQLCTSAEDCYMQVFLENGTNHYYGGCGVTNNCAFVQSPTSSSPMAFRHPGRQVCGECCQDPVCYTSLCRQITVVDFCASCDDASSLSECQRYHQCPGEVCYMQVFKDALHGRNRIYAGCALPQACAVVRVQPLATNMSLASSGPPDCGECCSDRSFCNSASCAQALSQIPKMSSSTGTTPIPTTSTGDFCRVCNGETSLTACSKNQMQVCSNTEECYMQVFEENGINYYYGGCGETNNCAHVQSPTSASPAKFRHQGRQICGECCQDPSCYTSLCQQISFVDFCAHCENAQTMSECLAFKQCPGENCYLQRFNDGLGGSDRIYAGCALPQACSVAKYQSLTTNASITPSGSLVCGDCCNDRSMCNSGLCQATTTASTSTSTTTSALTTTPTGGPTIMCIACHDVTSLAECHTFHNCPAEECFIQVYKDVPDRRLRIFAGCAKNEECSILQQQSLLTNPDITPYGVPVCGDCCMGNNMCNANLCRKEEVDAIKELQLASSSIAPQAEAHVTTQSTTSTVTTTVTPIQCEVCNGTHCGLIPGHDPVMTCPPETPYCMNNVETEPSGSKAIIKRCTSLDECNRRWWHETSDSSNCISFDPSITYRFRLSCYFCCTKSGCNKDIVPDRATMYIGDD